MLAFKVHVGLSERKRIVAIESTNKFSKLLVDKLNDKYASLFVFFTVTIKDLKTFPLKPEYPKHTLTKSKSI